MSIALRSELDVCVDALATAAAERVPIEPLSTTYPELTVEDAYAIQAAGIESPGLTAALAIGDMIASLSDT